MKEEEKEKTKKTMKENTTKKKTKKMMKEKILPRHSLKGDNTQ